MVKSLKISIPLIWLLLMEAGSDCNAQVADSSRRLSDTLKEVVITDKTFRKVLNTPNEYIVDYLLCDKRILVGAQHAANSKKSRLVLLDETGTVVAKRDFPEELQQLFESCTGSKYVLTDKYLYQVSIHDSIITLGRRYAKTVLDGLKECEQCYNGKYYYKFVMRQQFKVDYCILKSGDSVFTPFAGFESESTVRSSFEELAEIREFIRKRRFNEASRLARTRMLADRYAMKFMDVPLHRTRDSFLLINFEDNRIQFYNEDGGFLQNIPISLPVKGVASMEILKDPVTGKFYLHQSNKRVLQEIDVHTGKPGVRAIVLEKLFAQRVKVFDGAVYYLWQDNAATRQLYMQR